MKIKIISLSFILLLSSFFVVDKSQSITIYMIGDSTMADKAIEKENQERGWGQMLPEFLTDDIVVENHARNGRSTLSFINEGRWDKVLSLLKKGDYVFIQFGHNDEKTDEDRHTIPGGSFDENLRRFVRETQAKGAYPVLFNSIARRNFPPSGQKEHKSIYESEGTSLVDTHGEYAVAPKKVAKEMNIPFVDMTGLTHELIESMGVEESKKLFMWIPAGVYEAHPNGKIDNTHLNIYGGRVIAEIAIREVVKLIPELAPYVTD